MHKFKDLVLVEPRFKLLHKVLLMNLIASKKKLIKLEAYLQLISLCLKA
ncbi:hypothetical protein ES705_27208 [subsurface metagenome]